MRFTRYIVEEDSEKIVWMDWNWNKHRDGDLPAIEYKDGTQIWYKNGVKHRDNDLPAVIFLDGHQEWWMDGKLHRDEGPAITRSEGRLFYFKNGVEYYPDGEDLS
jgi:hypothetical protein